MKKIKSESELKEAVLNGDIVICKFGANWCGPCKVIEKIVEKIEESNIDSAEFLDVDVEEADEDFIAASGIRNIPVLQYYKNGVLVDKTVGLITEQDLIQRISELKED